MALDVSIQISSRHRVFFTRAVFGSTDGLLARLLAEEGRQPVQAVIFVDDGLPAHYPGLIDTVTDWFDQCEVACLALPPVILPGGESGKNDWRQVERVWETIHEAKLCRHSFALALGGGALLDLVGFGAATAHRGIRLIRLPTTSLAQGDGGVGVKNAVNYFHKKNWVGTFQVPHAVINDTDFLKSLPPRELRGGLVEALKVALIRDEAFYRRIAEQRQALGHLQERAIHAVLERSAELHVAHIASSGDPFEAGSARPLDFGHWAAHKLEQLSDFEIGHGDAVAVGMAVDIVYAARMGMLPRDVAAHILNLMADLHFPIFHPLLAERDSQGRPVILDGLEEFREHLGGELTITLLEAVGQGREVHEVDAEEMMAAIDELGERPESNAPPL